MPNAPENALRAKKLLIYSDVENVGEFVAGRGVGSAKRTLTLLTISRAQKGHAWKPSMELIVICGRAKALLIHHCFVITA